MVKRLYCRVGVVLSITLVVWLTSTHLLFAQTPQPEVTLSCQGISLESALEKISQRAGVFFIYSPSLLNLNKVVSFSAQSQPLNKLLDQLGKEMNLTFRHEGKYVIIKKSELIAEKPEIKIFSPPIASANLSSGSSVNRLTQQKHVEYLSSIASFPKPSPLEVKTPQLTPLKPLEVIAPKGLMHKQWFVSGGMIANGYTSGGAEIRGGLKPLYGVINFGLLNQGRYRMGYGLGTTASMTDKLSVNLIYNFGQILGRNEIALIRQNSHFVSEKNYSVNMKHSQMKLMLQYDIHPRFFINAGASFNLLKTNYQLQNVFHSISIVSSYAETEPIYGVSGSNVYTVERVISPTRSPLSSFQTTRAWVSWEVGMFYRVDF
jgi:hypothetical protein